MKIGLCKLEVESVEVNSNFACEKLVSSVILLTISWLYCIFVSQHLNFGCGYVHYFTCSNGKSNFYLGTRLIPKI